MKTKKNNKQKYRLMIAFGAFFAAVASFCSFHNLISDAVASGIIGAATCLFTIGIVRLYIRKEPLIDEMVKTANQKAISGAWVLTLILTTMLFWINLIFKDKLSVMLVLSIILYFMLFSVLILRYYYLKHGIEKT